MTIAPAITGSGELMKKALNSVGQGVHPVGAGYLKGTVADRTAASVSGSGRTIRERLCLESFLVTLSAAFAKSTADRIEREINLWVRRLSRFLGVDRISLWEYSSEDSQVHCRLVYSARHLPPLGDVIPRDRYPWLTDQYRRGRNVVWRRIPEDIPPEAAAEREHWLHAGAKSVLGIPMWSGSRLHVIAFASYGGYKNWPPAMIRRLRLVGKVFLCSLSRQRTERALREIEAHHRAMLKALSHTTFTCTREGRYIDYFPGDQQAYDLPPATRIGRNIGEFVPADVARSLRNAFERAAGTGECVQLEYSTKREGEIRHTEARIVSRDDETLVCVERDITAHRRAIAEIERLRWKLTYVGRLNLMGHLTASLAHQLLQPITAILSNSEAGLRLLQSHRQAPIELVSILTDIAESGKNAGNIVHVVSDLLHDSARPLGRLDLHEVVRGAIDVLQSDLILHNARLTTRLDAAKPNVVGDFVQLQQVVFNLVMNALEAVRDGGSGDSELLVATQDRDDGVEMTVSDRGSGVHVSSLQKIFGPFFTTKPQSIGMGLHICSEIVRLHGGRIWAQNNVGSPGLTVHCWLPTSPPLEGQEGVSPI
jgi:two-component system, LuxR family, sensor kinase FixL